MSINSGPFSSHDRPAHVVGACLDPIRLPALRSGLQHLASRPPPPAATTRRRGAGHGRHARPGRLPQGRHHSLGTRQRLTLTAALLGDPQVVVLDEPTAGLDVHGVAWLRRELREWADAGRTVLVASHSLTSIG